uniref:Myb/SANT-like domain-containing protein n=1 Tax=Arundo donax TaxID=35708 RepID=A0A0A9HHB6_ARUDO
MNNRGYANIAQKFLMRTRLHHSKLQLKNRWDNLKGFYGFWQRCLKDTSLGWDNAKEMVRASENWWKANIARHAEWRNLKNGPLECVDELEAMFYGVAMDGSSLVVPGEGVGKGGGDGGDDGDEEDEDAGAEDEECDDVRGDGQEGSHSRVAKC